MFATLYWLDSSGLENSDGSWLSCFFFSVQTIGTIGYGAIYPNSFYTNFLVTLESAIGLVVIAILTGFFFAKFSRASSKIEYTSKMIITTLNEKRTLMFRVINIRKNQVLNSTIHLTALIQTSTHEGISYRKFSDLKLERSHVPLFSMSMTVMHVIDEESPLFKVDKMALEKMGIEFIVTSIGTDSTFGQSIHAVQTYSPEDIEWNKHFADMVEVCPDGSRIIDYSKFNNFKS
jgi:inward rectifier potassium channel